MYVYRHKNLEKFLEIATIRIYFPFSKDENRIAPSGVNVPEVVRLQ